MHSKDLAIGVLSTTAVILLVGLILLNAQPQPAYASGMGDRGGDYIAVSGAMWAQQELVYVFNTAENKMIVYRFDQQKDRIIASPAADLSVFLDGKKAQPNKQRPRGGKRRRNP